MSDGITDSQRGFTWYMFRCCGICGKSGHYSEICPNKQTVTIDEYRPTKEGRERK